MVITSLAKSSVCNQQGVGRTSAAPEVRAGRQVLGSKRTGIFLTLTGDWTEPEIGASLVAQMVKNLPAMKETPGLILMLGRTPGERNGYPLQYSFLENSMDKGDCRPQSMESQRPEIGLGRGSRRSVSLWNTGKRSASPLCGMGFILKTTS